MSSPRSALSEIPIFHLLLPAAVPPGRRAFDRVPMTLRRRALGVCSGVEPLSDAAALARSRAALQAARPAFRPAPAQPSAPATIADERTHDAYCRIVRVEGDGPRIFLHSVLQAHRELIEERMASGTTLAEGDWLRLRSAPESILRYALGQPMTPLGQASRTPTDDQRQGDPVRRWIMGHHVFLALIQGLILAFHDLEAALLHGREEQAAAAFELSILLFQGSGLAFRFATDFPPVDYQDVVRPTMMPPHSPPGLSGLLAADHRHLIQRLAALKPRFETLTPVLEPFYQCFRAAFEATYDAHRLVCARFNGAEKPSLLTRPTAEISAVELLKQFKCTRMKLLPIKPTHSTQRDDKVSPCSKDFS